MTDRGRGPGSDHFGLADAVRAAGGHTLIDHVLARPGRPGATVAVREAFLAGDRPIDGIHPSDHYAIGADLDP